LYAIQMELSPTSSVVGTRLSALSLVLGLEKYSSNLFIHHS